jgi:hypothetical protein
MRRALGYRLKIAGWQLEQFATEVEQTGPATVMIENAVAWATAPAGATPSESRRSPDRPSRYSRTHLSAGRSWDQKRALDPSHHQNGRPGRDRAPDRLFAFLDL